MSGGTTVPVGSTGTGGTTSSGGTTVVDAGSVSTGGATVVDAAPGETGGTTSSGGTTVVDAGPVGTGGATSSGGATVVDAGPIGTGGATVVDAGPIGTGGATVVDAGPIGTGGATSSGGATVVDGGGPIATGGATATGGTTATGGATATGGTTATGGATASGGTTMTATGGNAATDGGPGGGGVSGTGGFAASGGVTGSGTCDDPYMIATDVARADVTVDTATGRTHDFDLPCAQNSTTVVLSFILTEAQLVYADTFGASWNTVLFFADGCDASAPAQGGPGTSVCSDDACGTSQSQAIATLGYGQHYLIVSGAAGASGTVTVHFQHAQIGNGPLTLLPSGSGTTSGTTSGIGVSNQCQASAPENSYWWATCPSFAGGSFTATTCGGATFDTVLSMNVPRSQTALCADDDPACGVQSTVSLGLASGAGIQVLTVDGNTGSDAGPYTLTYTRP